MKQLNKSSNSQSNNIAKNTLWVSVMFIVTSFASLSLVSTSFSSAPSTPLVNNYSQPYQLVPAPTNASANLPTVVHSSEKPVKQSSNTIPSPAPLSLVALLLIVLASAIRRHQNQI